MEILKSATRMVLLIDIIAIVTLNIFQIDVSETLNYVTVALISFYFWQKSLNGNK